MNESTREQYIKLGAHFISKVQEKYGMDDLPPKLYRNELLSRAHTTTPAYWRRLRTAYAEWCFNEGYNNSGKQVKALVNPVTANKGSALPEAAKKRRKATGLNDKDFAKLYAGADNATKAVMMVIRQTGCRPSEIASIKAQGFWSYHIESAKKSAGRGLDRTLVFDTDNRQRVEVLRNSIETLRREAAKDGVPVEVLVERVQRRFDRLAVKTFPRRKLKVCLYSMRHQMGSNLKASGMSRKEIAYIMGHQSTKSIERYGDRRKASGGAGLRAAGDFENAVRENHKPIDNARTFENPLHKRWERDVGAFDL